MKLIIKEYAYFPRYFTPVTPTAAIKFKCFMFSVQNYKPLYNSALQLLPAGLSFLAVNDKSEMKGKGTRVTTELEAG
jgi:hypothetical protein